MLRNLLRAPLLRLFVKRIIQAIPVVGLVSFITFSLMNLLPGSAPLALLGEQATPASINALDLRLHLNEPFFTRYVNWLGDFVTGNLGTSLATNQSVTSILSERLPVTLELGIISIILAVVFSVVTAVAAAARRGRTTDRLTVVFSIVGVSVPNFVLALLLISVVAVDLHWLPSSGYVPISAGFFENLRSMILPSCAIALGLTCVYNRVLRADLVDLLVGAEFIVLARAKGVSSRRIILMHALRNASFGFLTLIAVNLGTLIGGAVLIEQIFSLPGMGQELVQAITYRDTIVVETVVVLLSMTVIVANLLADMIYAVLDPRIRYGSAR